jgi:hypothetical protein
MTIKKLEEIEPIWIIPKIRGVHKLLHPPCQNVRRLRITQKSTFSKFDQVYTQKYEQLQY